MAFLFARWLMHVLSGQPPQEGHHANQWRGSQNKIDDHEIIYERDGPQVTTRDSRISEKNGMSRRGIHPLLRGLDRPQRVAPSKRAVLLSGLESAQRKRYLRSQAEESETSTSVLSEHSSQ